MKDEDYIALGACIVWGVGWFLYILIRYLMAQSRRHKEMVELFGKYYPED